MIALAVMLLAAAMGGWLAIGGASPDVRSYARFACVLYAALAAAGATGVQLALSVTLIVSASAPVFLALAVRLSFRGPVMPLLVGAILSIACVAGITAAATGLAMLAFAPLLFSVVAMIAFSLRQLRNLRAQALQTIAASCALLAGASAFTAGGVRAMPALFLFSAAGLLGILLALAPRSDVVVEQERVADVRAGAIRQPR
ncbi:MAG TPA: hypothetical protein VMF58_05650 [Rhizomicrobium sp.]|nr:hypothetical protein [Rhizomicrobium sp.]